MDRRKSGNKGNDGTLQAMVDGLVFAGQCECGAGSAKWLFDFMGWQECRVRPVWVQRRHYAEPRRELPRQ